MGRRAPWMGAAFTLALPALAMGQANPFAGFGGTQGDASGTAAFPFLRLPVGARALALGGHELTTGQEAAALCAFPAALGSTRDWRYSLSHAEVLGEFRHEDLSLVLPLPMGGTVGVNSTALFSGAIEDARDIDENPTQASATDLLLGLGYGRAILNDALAAGARLDLFRSGVADVSALGYAFSAASSLRLADQFQFAVALNHLSHGARYDGPGAPLEIPPMSWLVEFGRPLAYHLLSWHAGFEHGNDGIAKYYAGAEWKILAPLLVRGGYQGSLQDRELSPMSGLSAGFGFTWDALTVDYGFRAMPPLGFDHALALHYSRKSKWGHPDQRLLLRAREKYREGKYPAALKSCREAVALNPYNYQALAFCQQIERDQARILERSITLLYTANAHGAMATSWINGQSLGGFTRRQAKLRELTQSTPRTVVVDGGELLDAVTGEEHAEYLFAAYETMPYQAVNVTADAGRYAQVLQKHPLPWVGGVSENPSHREVVLEGDLRVRIYGTSAPGNRVFNFAQGLRADFGSGAPATLRVLLMQGTLAEARDMARLAPELDAIVLSGERGALGQPLQTGSTLIVCPGVRGTYLGQLTFALEKDGRRRAFSHRLIPLDATVPEDEAMRKLLDPAVADLNLALGDIGMDDYRATVIAAVARRPQSQAQLFLSDLGSGKIFPVDHPGLSASAPALGYGKNKVVFVGEDSAGRKEFYLAQPGQSGLDTLTRFGGAAVKARFILKSQALLATYRGGAGHAEATHLVRIDPWSRGIRDLSGDRFGDVGEFAIGPSQDQLAFYAGAPGADTLWLATLDATSPLALAAGAGFAGPPVWSPDGKRLAFLQRDRAGDSEGMMRVFDFEARQFLSMPMVLRAHSAVFSADNKTLILSSGINVLDLQEVRLDSMTVRHMIGSASASKSGEHPRLKRWGNREGVLFESVSPTAGRSVRFLDFATGEEMPILEGDREYFLE